MKIQKVHAICHFHSDLEWWKTESDYAKDCLAICRKAVELLERYPTFTYVLDQAYSVIPLLREDPTAFNMLKNFVRQGRVEPVGATISAPDHNLPTGEALVRNFLLGNRWWFENFDFAPRVGWGLDTFGHPPQLPQIMAKSGLDSYVFSRGLDPFTDKDPSAFIWEAPDGTQVYSFWFVATYAGMLPVFPRTDWNIKYHFREMKARLEYEGRHNPSPIQMIPMGFDFQKPSISWIEFVAKWNDSQKTPPVNLSTPSQFFAELKNYRSSLPIRLNEINPIHSGGYESRHKIKQVARRLEYKTLDWERLSAVAWLQGNEYPSQKINETWHQLIKNNFHDTINGTPIDPAMKEAFARAESAEKNINAGLIHCISTIAEKVNTVGSQKQVLLINPLPWSRKELVTIPWSIAQGKMPVDGNGQPLTYQGTRQGLVAQINLKSLSIDKIELRQTKSKTVRQQPRIHDHIILEDENLRAIFDSRGLISLFNIKSNLEIFDPEDVKPSGIRVLYDFGNLWTVAMTGDEETGAPNGKAILLESGPLRSIAQVKADFPSCEATTRYSLIHGYGWLDVETKVILKNRDRRILAWFPLAFSGDFICETPFHATKREPGHWACQGWAGVFSEKMGLAIVNQGIPSVVYDQKGLALGLMRSVSVRPIGFGKFLRKNLHGLFQNLKQGLRLTWEGINLIEIAMGQYHWIILREYASSGIPFKPGLPNLLDLLKVHARHKTPSDAWDLGEHVFHYRLIPTQGAPQYDQLTKIARQFASPVILHLEAGHEGKLNAPVELLHVDGDAVCEVIKKAQDSDDLLIRAFDASGKGAKLIIQPEVKIKKALRISLTEDIIYQEEKILHNRMEASLSPWEIATFILKI